MGLGLHFRRSWLAGRAVAHAAVPLAVGILVSLCLSTNSAKAACAPDPALSGQTITCSGTDADGFQAGAGVNSLTVNVQPGATVNDNGAVAIGLNDSNAVTNNGTIAAAAGATGLSVGNSNTVTNNSVVTTGVGGIGVFGLDANQITNNGSVTSGDSGVSISIGDNNAVINTGNLATGSRGTGIFAGQNNTITNTATGIITVVDQGVGIFVSGNSTVTNAGTITTGFASGPAGAIFAINDNNTIINTAGATISVGADAAGIFVQGNNSIISNAGMVTTSTNGPGIDVQGNNAVITNSGTVNGSGGSAGIVLAGLSSTITNSGRIVVGNSAEGIVVLGDGNTVVNSGTLTVGRNGSAIGIDVSSFGAVSSNQVINTGTINVGVNATGILISGGGTVFNSGTINAATGFAAIEFCGCGTGNVLTLGPGSVINGQVIGTGTDTFQLGGTGTDTFDLNRIGAGKQYDGFAVFNKVDTSNWTVVGTGAQDWNVLGGTLSVNGTITGAVTVNPGGTLGGNGIVGDTTINGGTLAPGNSVGLLTVQGSLVFTAASTYLVEVSTGADRTNVTGTATPGGATVNAMLIGGNIFKQYTILNATGGVVGTFNPQVGINVPNFVPSLTYDLNNVYLNFALNFNPPGGLNINQQNVANTLTNFFNANGGIPLVFGALTPAGLSQASGEIATGTQQATFNAMSLFLNLLTDPLFAGRDGSVTPPGAQPYAEESEGSLAYAAKQQNAARDALARMPTKAEAARNDLLDPHWSVWGSAYGGGANIDGNAALGSNSASVRAFGFVAGADYRISRDTIAGFALAGGGTNFSVNGFGTGRSDLFQAGAFVRHNVGAAYVTAAAAYGWQDVTTDRTVTISGLDHLRAEFNANAFSGRIEGGYCFVTPWMGVTPYAAGQFTTYSLPAYAEQVLSGTGTFALNYAAKDVTDPRTELGVRTDRSYAAQNAILILRSRFAWAHDFNTDRNVAAVFQTLPGAAFVVNGAAQSHDSALTTASVEMRWLNGWSAAATFEGEFSGISQSYAGKGVVRYAW
jgi:uncharacterized protein with beta-barrel porin domain